MGLLDEKSKLNFSWHSNFKIELLSVCKQSHDMFEQMIKRQLLGKQFEDKWKIFYFHVRSIVVIISIKVSMTILIGVLKSEYCCYFSFLLQAQYKGAEEMMQR
jgi:hypothetical protein